MKLGRVIVVDVRESDIQRARSQGEKNCQSCPIALALKAATGMVWGVSRSGCFCKRYGRVDFPERVTAWVDSYDRHENVRPIAFSLIIPRAN